MSPKLRLRLFLLLLLLPSASAAAWGVHSYLVRRTAAHILTTKASESHGRDAGVNVRNSDGETVLFSAVAGSDARAETVSSLIARGADVNVQNNTGETALMQAVEDSPSREQTAIVQAILAAPPRLELKDDRGDTAWRISSKAGNNKLAGLLERAGAVKYSIFPPVPVQRAAYSVTDLGRGQANALNNRGDVVGIVSTGQTDGDGQLLGQAFLWSRGHMQTLKGLYGPSSSAEGINNKGEVVGQADFSKAASSSVYTRHAFLWRNGVMQDLHPRSGWASKSRAYPSIGIAVNNKGEVAEAVNADGFLWHDGRWRDLKTNESRNGLAWDDATPVAMNDSGQIILHLQHSGTDLGGVWNGGRLAVLPSPDNGPITVEGHTFSPLVNNFVYGINDHGAIVGQDDYWEAVLWTRGKPKVLPGLYRHGVMRDEMRAEHINNRSHIVGTVSDDLDVRNPEQHAVLWADGKVTDLNALIPAEAGWVLEDAHGINERGQIAGRGTFHGKEHAFLLTPLTGSKRVY